MGQAFRDDAPASHIAIVKWQDGLEELRSIAAPRGTSVVELRRFVLGRMTTVVLAGRTGDGTPMYYEDSTYLVVAGVPIGIGAPRTLLA